MDRCKEIRGMNGSERNLSGPIYNIALPTRTLLLHPLPLPPCSRLWLRVLSILGSLSYAKPSSALHCGALWDREPRSSLPHLVYFSSPSPPRLFRTPSRPQPSYPLHPYRPLIPIAFYSSAFQRHPLTQRDSFRSFYFFLFRFLKLRLRGGGGGEGEKRREERGARDKGNRSPFSACRING